MRSIEGASLLTVIGLNYFNSLVGFFMENERACRNLSVLVNYPQRESVDRLIQECDSLRNRLGIDTDVVSAFRNGLDLIDTRFSQHYSLSIEELKRFIDYMKADKYFLGLEIKKKSSEVSLRRAA